MRRSTLATAAAAAPRIVSRNSRGRVSNAWSWQPSLSPNGRFVAFCSTASNLARPDRRPRVPHLGNGRSALFTATLPGLVPQDIRHVRQSDAFVAEPLR